ncbi:hypothetical protein ACUN22_17330 [Streptomyces anulatus]|uniref:hypothetical protein n=1 Tax=Streptomyces anulatus TaxID=1892 RepID=UPI00403D89D7
MFRGSAAPGYESVWWFRDADGTGSEISLTTVQPGPKTERVAYAWDAVVAAIGNHPHFIRAALEQPSFGPLNLNTITARTRTGNGYTLKLDMAELREGEGAGERTAVRGPILRTGCEGPRHAARARRRHRVGRPGRHRSALWGFRQWNAEDLEAEDVRYASAGRLSLTCWVNRPLRRLIVLNVVRLGQPPVTTTWHRHRNCRGQVVSRS